MNYCVYNNHQSIKLPNGSYFILILDGFPMFHLFTKLFLTWKIDGGQISGSCTIYTRKFQSNYEHVPEMHFQERARKKTTKQFDLHGAQGVKTPSEPVSWQVRVDLGNLPINQLH
jgi:hypothetical protein